MFDDDKIPYYYYNYFPGGQSTVIQIHITKNNHAPIGELLCSWPDPAGATVSQPL